MTTTILAAIALTGGLVPAAKPEFQAQTDYGQAMRQAAAEGKPMAVLIGSGNGFAKLLGDAGMSAGAAQLLRDKFVCVAVDVSTPAGAQLAGQFQLTDGLVISSSGGTHQALRHAGAVSAGDLAKHAAAYATVTGTPATTVTVGTAPAVVSAPYTVVPAGYSAPFYPGTVIRGGCSGGSCATGGYVIGGYAPTYSLPTVGGCANGRCPTPR